MSDENKNVLTQDKLNQLLETTSLEEFLALAKQFGVDPEAPVSEWAPVAELSFLGIISDHFSHLKSDPASTAIDAATAGADIDGDGQISTFERDAAIDAASEVDPDAGQEVSDRLGSSLNAPRWILDTYNNGQILTREQQERILRDINFEYGAGFENWDQLMQSGMLDQTTNETQELVQYALLDQEPIESFTVSYGNNKQHAIEAIEFQQAQEKFGVDQRDLMHMVRLADRVGISNRNGDRPSWQVALALAKATNMIGQLTATAAGGSPGGGMTDFWSAIDDQEARNQRGGSPNDASAPGEPVYIGDVDAATFTTSDQYQNLSSNILRGEMNQGTALGPRRETLSFRELGQRFNEGLEKYNYDPLVAFLHSVDGGLAARLAYSKGDITKLKGKDVYLARGILSDAGFSGFGEFQQTMMQMGYGEAEGAGFDNLWNYFAAIDEQQRQTGADRGPAGPTEPTPKYPDPAGLNETVRSLYQQLFFEEPDDATLERFRSQINAAVDHAFDNDISSVDISARARQFLRDSPQYEEFYSNKPEGLSEEEYAAQMQYAQQSMLGNELAGNKAAREGLRTGKYQTAVGAAAGTAEAWDNSTFLGRLARAGEVVGRNT